MLGFDQKLGVFQPVDAEMSVEIMRAGITQAHGTRGSGTVCEILYHLDVRLLKNKKMDSQTHGSLKFELLWVILTHSLP